MPDASPTKWHLAHITWFFETFLLERFEAGFVPFDPAFRVLFNSYYQGVGEQHPRPQRGLITRPTLAEVQALSRRRRRAHAGAARRARATTPRSRRWSALGLQHEQQHQELLLTDIKHALRFNPLAPGLCAALADGAGAAAAAALVRLRGRPGRARPRRRRSTAPSASTTRRRATAPTPRRSSSPRGRSPTASTSPSSTTAATAGPSSGCRWAGTGCSARPAHARRSTGARDGDRWLNHTLQGTVEIDPHTPVCHLSYFEADAFARWAGARLPTELEWEHRGARAARAGRAATSPTAAPSTRCRRATPVGDEPVQMFGDVWEWTQSAYLPYPGYRPLPGAVGEYNGKFMCNQFVLRGGSCATPAGHVRASYRNFFPPDAQWQFSGVRLARDLLRSGADRAASSSTRGAAAAQPRRAPRVEAERARAEGRQHQHAAGDRQVLHEVDLLRQLLGLAARPRSCGR